MTRAARSRLIERAALDRVVIGGESFRTVAAEVGCAASTLHSAVQRLSARFASETDALRESHARLIRRALTRLEPRAGDGDLKAESNLRGWLEVAIRLHGTAAPARLRVSGNLEHSIAARVAFELERADPAVVRGLLQLADEELAQAVTDLSGLPLQLPPGRGEPLDDGEDS